MPTPDENWANDSIQFPRLLSEIWSFGLTTQQYAFLKESMDLTGEQIDELFERADVRWQQIKAATRPR